MITSYPQSETLARRSADSIAGGVVSLNRKVDPSIVFVRAEGSRLWDADGNEYIDYHAAFAPHLLGHNDPGVNGAIREAMERGWSLVGSGPTPWEMRLAELLRRAVPTMESLQLTNTGSDLGINGIHGDHDPMVTDYTMIDQPLSARYAKLGDVPARSDDLG